MELTAALIFTKTKVDNLALVKNLNLWGCDLSDVSILRTLPNLEILALSVNKVSTLVDIAQCVGLKELYLRKNDISQLSEVHRLSKLPHLQILWLCDNPCASHPLYRIFTIRCCPALKQFDNVEVSPQERAEADRLPQAEVDDVLAGRGRSGRPQAPPPPPAAPSPNPSQDGAKPREKPPVAQTPTPAPAPQPSTGASTGSTNRHTQKNIVSAVTTLLNELTVESLQFLQEEIADQIRRKKTA
jgi:hypothetical protein